MTPLVSCWMLQHNRPIFLPMTIECWLAQTYPNLELVVVDDGDPVRDLLPKDERITYIHVGHKLTVGQKHNIGAHACRGDIMAFWPDDDWCHPERLARQVEHLLAHPEAEVTAISRVPYVNLQDGARWIFDVPGKALDGTYLWHRRWWERGGFPDRADAMQAAAFLAGKPEPVLLDDPRLYLGIRHNGNVWTGHFASDMWKRDPEPTALPASVEALLADDRVCQPVKVRELVFKLAAWTDDDAWVNDLSPYRQAILAGERMFRELPVGTEVVVVVRSEPYRVRLGEDGLVTARPHVFEVPALDLEHA